MVSAQIGISKDDAEKLAFESEKAKKFIDSLGSWGELLKDQSGGKK